MDLLYGNVKKVYFNYLSAAFGSALISSIYSTVDMAVVGQYQGPAGTAALAIVSPIWNIVYSLGLLMGIGGSVLLGAAKGRGDEQQKNEWFTSALIGTIVLAVISWGGVALFDTQLLQLFGAEETLLPLAKEYLFPIKFIVPLFLFNQLFTAFLRNDNAPALATVAVLSGGIFNVFGDFFFVFTLDMGIFGAGLATAIGALISVLVMLTHFFTRKNTLKLVKPHGIVGQLRRITVTGISTFFIDAAMGILTMLFNRQIVRYLGTDALAVYGIIVMISTVVQCCAYSVGQAAQPIISINYGAESWTRIKETLKYALYAVCFFSLTWTALICAIPNGFVRVFMTPSAEILRIAPFILRSYGISFLLLPLNIFSTYYFQALMKPVPSFAVSVARGLLISGSLILTLPVVARANALWYAMPITEAVVAVAVIGLMVKYTKQLAN